MRMPFRSSPFSAKNAAALVNKIVEDNPPRLRKSNDSSASSLVDRDLETICLKCLEKEPEHRYACAAAWPTILPTRWRRHGSPFTPAPALSANARAQMGPSACRSSLPFERQFAATVGLIGFVRRPAGTASGTGWRRAARLSKCAADMNVVNRALLSGDPGKQRMPIVGTIHSQTRPA